MPGGGVWSGRVVAVVSTFPGGKRRPGSGLLVGPDRVWTAWHCVRDPVTRVRAEQVLVRRLAGGGWQETPVTARTVSWDEPDVDGLYGLDVAVLHLTDPPWAGDPFPPLRFARVDRDQAGEVVDCVAVGFPDFAHAQSKGVDAADRLELFEVHGSIRQLEGLGAGKPRLILHDYQAGQVGDGRLDSPWGGLSGAVVFHQGRVLGHVVRHEKLHGTNPLTIIPVDRIAHSTADRVRTIADLIGLDPEQPLPWANAVLELGGVIELRGNDGDLPYVRDLTPYQLGADPTFYGTTDTYGQHDPYVPRSIDPALRDACELPNRLVLVVGPSKAGKTRTAFEAIRATLPDARLLKPAPTHLIDALTHPRITDTTTPLVIWLDDLQRFLTGENALTPARISDLFQRPGHTHIIATLRDEVEARLHAQPDLTPGTRQLLDNATTHRLEPTRDDPAEQDAAAAAYPDLDLSQFGLAEQLTGAPAIRDQYVRAKAADPLLRTILEVAIDWERVGIPYPIPDQDLRDLATQRLIDAHSPIKLTDKKFAGAIETAINPPEDEEHRKPGLVSALTVDRSGPFIVYLPYPYLTAYDDAPGATPNTNRRAIPGLLWTHAVERFREDPDTLVWVAGAAYSRDNIDIAFTATRIAADHEQPVAMFNLGVLLAGLDPPDRDGARAWYQKAADAGHTGAMSNLGLLLEGLDPPDRDGARTWYQKAADAGNTNAMNNLGLLLEGMDPPDRDGARTWYQKAADAGNTNAMNNLGLLLEGLDPPDRDGARTWYQKAADAGNTNAMNNLGVLLAGLDPPDRDGARAWYQKAADAGHTGAMFNLGLLLEGLDPPDRDGARTWYQKAADAGNTDAMVNLGLLLEGLDPPDRDGARTWYQKAADAGDTDAMNNLGVLLAGLDPPDRDGARTWYQNAADAGNTNAMNNLGVLLEGLDPPDRDGARTWYQNAADAGNTNAMNNLGLLLAGLDPPDRDGARTWYQKAADAGNTNAMFNLGLLLNRLHPPDRDGTRTWYQKAADAGNTDAMVNLGLLLEGLDPPDRDGARTWYQKAADAGDTDAMVNLGLLLAGLDPPDRDGARTWYQKAADAGDTDAMNNLGLLLEGLDPPDRDGARTWFQKAADAGNTNAMFYLGAMLEGMDPPDLEGARTWYRKAAEAGDTDAMNNLGWLLAFELDPPDVESGRVWLEKAVRLGDVEAMSSLGELLATRITPPDLKGAREWLSRAADQGSASAQQLLQELFPPTGQH